MGPVDRGPRVALFLYSGSVCVAHLLPLTPRATPRLPVAALLAEWLNLSHPNDFRFTHGHLRMGINSPLRPSNARNAGHALQLVEDVVHRIGGHEGTLLRSQLIAA